MKQTNQAPKITGMTQIEKLTKQLKQVEQENGVLKHKMKQRKEDKNNFNEQYGKLKNRYEAVRGDLTLAYKNLEESTRKVIAFRGVFKILQMSQKEEEELLQELFLAKEEISKPQPTTEPQPTVN